MTTIYTLRGKVLRNSATKKWLTKKEDSPTPEPTGFVMNASNIVAIVQSGYYYFAVWESPSYPEAGDLGGKTLQVNLSDAVTVDGQTGKIYLIYAKGTSSSEIQGPYATSNGITSSAAGTYTYVLDSNQALQAGYGAYLSMKFSDQTDVNKIQMTILD